ncbi:MAG: hypothetical protein ABI041_15475, partial [Bdellovibrionia bacterium]
GQKKYIFCPHTATAVFASSQLKGDWIVVSTAHPAKFNETIEPLVGHFVPLPVKLALLLNKKQHRFEIDADLDKLKIYLNLSR